MELLLKYFPDLSPEQIFRFSRLESLYREWNEKINVISRKDMDHFYERHVLHSLGIARIIPFKEGANILDVGTGGGFPGIPLAILFPGARFHLTDSIGKKIKVVNEVIADLRLSNVKAEAIRAEQSEDKYDFVVSRAVTRLSVLYNWTRDKYLKGGNHALENGMICLKGGDLEEELKELNRKFNVYDLKDHFEEPFFETKKVVYVPVR